MSSFKFELKAINSIFIKEGIFSSTYSQNEEYALKNLDFQFNSLGQFEKIGEGAFGNILLAKHKKTHKFCAVKVINKNLIENNSKKDCILKEISIQSSITHPNIVKLYYSSQDNINYYMVMEYKSGGNLYKYMKTKGRLNEKEAFYYFIQICSAIYFLHKNNITHRDIKLENILLDNNKKNIYLCDFGWSTDISGRQRKTFCGTYEYMSPEIINNKEYGKGSDIWALGILLYEMLHGYSPFHPNMRIARNPIEEIIYNIRKGKYLINNKISSECSDLIKKLLTPEEKNRIDIEGVIAHPWIVNNEKEYIKENDIVIEDNGNISNYEHTNSEDIKSYMVSNKIINPNNINNIVNMDNDKNNINYASNITNNTINNTNIINIMKTNKNSKINNDFNENNFNVKNDIINKIKNVVKKNENMNNNRKVKINNGNDISKNIKNLNKDNNDSDIDSIKNKYKSNNENYINITQNDNNINKSNNKNDINSIKNIKNVNKDNNDSDIYTSDTIKYSNKSKNTENDEKNNNRNKNNNTSEISGVVKTADYSDNFSNIYSNKANNLSKSTEKNDIAVRKLPHKKRVKFEGDDLNFGSFLFEEKQKNNKTQNKKDNIRVINTSRTKFKSCNKIITKNITKDKDALDLEEDEFNFLNKINSKRGTAEKTVNSKFLNLDFLPKELLYENKDYKDSSINILKSIDLVERAQQAQENITKNKILKNEKTKKEEKKGFWINLFTGFTCGCNTEE